MFKTWEYTDKQRQIANLIQPAVSWFVGDIEFGFDDAGALFVGGMEMAAPSAVKDDSWRTIFPVKIHEISRLTKNPVGV